jgi:hypothetical protein
MSRKGIRVCCIVMKVKRGSAIEIPDAGLSYSYRKAKRIHQI